MSNARQHCTLSLSTDAAHILWVQERHNQMQVVAENARDGKICRRTPWRVPRCLPHDL